MKKSEAAEIVMMLIAAYPATKATEQTSQVYEAMLGDLDADVARAAVQRLLATSRWMPTIAEIREACTAQTHGAARSGEQAWAELMMAKRKHGYDYGAVDTHRRSKDPLFGDPLIQQCLMMWGGWNAFALADEDAAARARFIALYGELAGRERQDLIVGKPLPRPERAPVLPLETPVAKDEPASMPAPMPVAQLVVALASTRPSSRQEPRPPSAFAGRRLTAAEIDAALRGTEEAAQ